MQFSYNGINNLIYAKIARNSKTHNMLNYLKQTSQTSRIIGFVFIFAVIGTALKFNSNAATNASISEAESGTLEGNTQIVSDATASGGSAITFEANSSAFPSRLRAQGRTIVDETGQVMPKLKGFNMQLAKDFVWTQSNFDDIASAGGTINRAVIFWDDFELTQGTINPAAIANLDTHIARAENAGMYTQLELHLNVGRYPAWASAYSSEMEKYSHYGQTITQYLANRYGNPASSKYTKSVLGFGLNEPPLDDATIRNGNNSIPYLEGIQRTMIGWFRAPGYAPDWIGFVAYGYAAATPIYDDSFQNPNAIDANPNAYDSVGGNVIIDFHDYFVGITGATASNPTAQARQWNGMIYPTYQGGPMVVPDSSPAPTYSSTATTRSQLATYIAPYKTFSTNADIPLMIGEWGWVPTANGLDAWIQDHMSAWSDAGSVIEMCWVYNLTTDTANDPWAARAGGTWRPQVLTWLAN